MSFDLNEYPTKLVTELRSVLRDTSAIFNGQRIEIGRVTHEASHLIATQYGQIGNLQFLLSHARAFGSKMQLMARIAWLIAVIQFIVILFLL